MDGRSRGRSSFDLTRVPARPCYPDESYSSRSTTVIVMRGTYLYRKRVLFHWSRHSVYKGPTARCRALRALRSFLYFSLSRSVTRQGQGERHSQKHYKTQFPDSAAGAIFRASEKRGWPMARAFNAFSGRHQSAAVRAQREGVVSISDTKRLPRN